MYLSQLILNPRARRVRSEVGNPYELHRTIMQAFPGKEEGGPGRVLFRLEQSPRSGGQELTLLVQSDKAPDWDKLDRPDGYRWPNSNNNPKAFDPVFNSGQRFYFRLRANPTVKRKFEGQTKSKRVGLYKEEEQRDWLNRKAEQGGFTVFAANITAEGKQGGKILHPGQTPHRLQHLAVRFDGLLQVTDPDRFLETLQNGIGSGKGFGFGLLSLARPEIG